MTYIVQDEDVLYLFPMYSTNTMGEYSSFPTGVTEQQLAQVCGKEISSTPLYFWQTQSVQEALAKAPSLAEFAVI